MTQYHITGTLLATNDLACLDYTSDIDQVAHTRIAVDTTQVAANETLAVADAAWDAAHDYALWRWEGTPQIASVEKSLAADTARPGQR